MLDLTTALIFTCIFLGALAALWLIVARTYPTIRAARYWAASAMAAIAGLAIVIVASRQMETVAVVSGGLAIVLANALAWAGIRCYVRRPVPTVAIAAGLVAVAGGLAYSAFLFPNIALRAVTLSAGQGAFLLAGGIDLWRARALRRGIGIRWATWGLLASALLHAVRIGVVLAGRSGTIVVAAMPMRTPMLFEIFFSAYVWNVALVLMAVEQLHDELAYLAGTDPLTGVANRRSFFEQGERERARATRRGTSFSLLVIDVDRFKAINDSYGHVGGDTVLRGLVDAVTACLRPSDTLARFGGDEFCALLPDTDAALARSVAERIQNALGGGEIALTVSIGIAEWHPGAGDLTHLIALADAALYRAKEEGRDRIVVAAADKVFLSGV
jgi:diguanylate cyclase (GGDEF)-like protein